MFLSNKLEKNTNTNTTENKKKQNNRKQHKIATTPICNSPYMPFSSRKKTAIYHDLS